MSGHSKWAGIKHKKAAVDAKRGKVFTKLIKEITASARESGGKLDANPRLRTAILKAKEANMPAENIDRAIKRGTGELPGVSYEEVTYEGYGPKGVAILVDALTDNKNRTTAEVRSILSKKGGNLAGSGSVAWMFHKKGYILVDKSATDEDTLMGVVLDAGADDMKSEDQNTFEVIASPTNFEAVKKALDENNISTKMAEVTMIPTSTIKIAGEDAKGILSLIADLEDNDDVQNVYANFDIPDEIIDKFVDGK